MKASHPIRGALTALAVLGTLACTSSAMGPADDVSSSAGPVAASGIDLNQRTSYVASSIEISKG